MNICVIPAKGTSRRIPGKNIRDFLGKPILAYSIETAQRSLLFDKILVSTRDTAVIEVAKRYGAGIVVRPFNLSEINHPDCGTNEVTRHALVTYAKATGKTIDLACCLYPCAPLTTVHDLAKGWEMTYLPGAWYTYAAGPDGADAGAWYWGASEAFLERLPFNRQSPHVWPVQIPAERCCDINTEEDWIRAEQLYTAMHQGEDHGTAD